MQYVQFPFYLLDTTNQQSVNIYLFFCPLFSDNLISNKNSGIIQLELEVIRPLAGTGKVFVHQTTNWWSQLKSAGSTIYANRHCLQLYKELHPERLKGTGNQDKGVDEKPKIIGDVFIHSTAYVHHTATVRFTPFQQRKLLQTFKDFGRADLD